LVPLAPLAPLAPLNLINTDIMNKKRREFANGTLDQDAQLLEEMKNTNNNIKEMKFRLSQLIEDKSNVHINIDITFPIPTTYIELFPALPQYFKIECPIGCLTPITLNFINLSAGDGDLEIYGSFNDKLPTERKYDEMYLHPKRIEI